MGMTVRMDIGRFKEQLRAEVDKLHAATRPAAQAGEFQARLRGAQRRFEQVAQAFGAHGERVTRAEDLPAAIARCLQALDEGRAALLVASVAKI